MDIRKCRFYKACMKKCVMNQREAPCESCESCCKWPLCHWPHKEKIVPSDVPKGHLAVYVGEEQRRYVIKVSLLKHPLFQALLDQAQEVYDFTAGSRLIIPCDEAIFLSVLRCAKSPNDRRLCIFL